MTRREFLILAQSVGLSSWFGEMAYAQRTTELRIRRNVTNAAAATDLDTLRKAVQILQGNVQAKQYASWMYWANSHGMPEDVPSDMAAVWFRCQHGTRHFLSWHRAYVFFFESLVRDLTQTDSFALPYWDWYASTGIPPAFAEATINGAKNYLFHKERAFKFRTLVKTALQRPTFDGFQGLLEGNPHGTVHVMVGDEMGAIETSARDPVFWAHHCNIDRLWHVWGKANPMHTNPIDVGWLRESFAFDLAGAKKKSVADLLETEQLQYAYDSSEITVPADAIPTPPPTTVEIPSATVAADQRRGDVSLKQGVSIPSQSVRLELRVAPEAGARFMAPATDMKTAPEMNLVLSDVKVTDAARKRGFDYRVYMNLPSSPVDALRHEDVYVGDINSFALSRHSGHSPTLTFRIDQLAPTLAKHSLWKTDKVSISLISDDTEAAIQVLTIGVVRLEVVSKPQQ